MGSAGKKDDDDRSSSSSSDNSDSSEGGASSIVLSLKDPTYLHVLHRYFRKLGSKSNPTDPNFTEAQAAEEIFDHYARLKSLIPVAATDDECHRPGR